MSFSLFAKNDANFKNFNKKMNQNIDEVLEQNPHLYETKPIGGRQPASVHMIDAEDSTDKLDDVVEQADTHTSW